MLSCINCCDRIRSFVSVVFLLIIVAGSQLCAESNPENEQERINRLSWSDHQMMLKQLGITDLRPGPSGDPSAPNAANSDESKANPYETIPDPLRFNDGTRVKSAEDWVRRKLELQEHFDREIYGRVPESIPNVTWNLLQENEASVEGIPVWKHLYEGVVKPSFDTEIDVSLDLVLVLPKDSQTPVPIVLEYDWTPRFPNMPEGPKPSWKAQVLKRGWGYALLDPTSFQADHGAGLQEGIIGLMNHGEPRGLDQWGVLKAWAWGASRVMDLLETVPQVDADKVVIEGLSRYGKAALVAMAYDERFAIGFIGSSGAGGAKLLRRVFGEQVENLASSGAYHWFTPNFIKYAGPLTANDLPVDAHELIALCAPRPVFISVGSPVVEGQWIDARGMFIAAVHAEPVCELLGKEGLGTIEYPEISNGLLGGEIAFRQHEGGHTVYPNWPSFLNWAERYF